MMASIDHITLFQSEYQPYDPKDPSGFSYETVVKRWPIIITGVIDQIHNDCHHLALQCQADTTKPDDVVSSPEKRRRLEAKISEGKQIIESLSRIKYRMGRDHELEPIPADGEAHVDTYNLELSRLKSEGRNTWFTAPWLFAECYLYRLFRALVATTDHWKDCDPFLPQKLKTFHHSRTSIHQIAATMQTFETEKEVLTHDDTKLEILFQEMLQMCLWGNATDLSLLTHLTEADIADLQAVGREAQVTRRQFILKDDQSAVWQHIKTLSDARVDFVLDNAGFELFTDLVFADFLVTYTPYVSKVVFHPKLIPWFVSDVTPPDFTQIFSSLLDPNFLTTTTPSPAAAADQTDNKEIENSPLYRLVKRWEGHLAKGVFALSVPSETRLGGDHSDSLVRPSHGAEFWTAPWPYWNMHVLAPELYAELREKSGLVVFKGDLNYRKLTGDVKWPSWTPFPDAIGPLAGRFPLLSLRTSKADVVVGVDRETVERLDASGEKWRVNGRYALISFLGKSE